MIRSMTGFGEALEQVDGVHYAVELRSLNNRYFKANIRLPDELADLEGELESHLRRRLSRGSITVVVKMRMSDALAVHKINDAALLAYLGHLETIHGKVQNREHAIHIDLTALLALPGVLQPSEDEQAILGRARSVLARLIDDACDKLGAMRATEGEQLAADFRHHSQQIRQRLTSIEGRTGQVLEEYHERLRSRVNDLMAKAQLQLNETDLIRELAVFAERSDISEELSRLAGHLEQFEQVIGSDDGEPAGRVLDFIAQEMLREANTIGSKSNDVPISRAIVEVKGSIDRIKEQVQNVE